MAALSIEAYRVMWSTPVWLRIGFSAASAAVFLALALISGGRRARNPLALQLGLMCVSLFAYEVSDVLGFVSSSEAWSCVADVAAALTAVFMFDLFVRFLGFAKRLEKLRLWAQIYFFLTALIAITPLVAPNIRGGRDRVFPVAMLLGLTPCLMLLARLVVVRTRRSSGVERARAQLAGAALLLGVGSVLSDLGAMSGLPFPRLSYAGLLIASLLLAALTFEARIVQSVRRATLLNVLVVAMIAVLAQVFLVVGAFHRTEIFVFGTLVVVSITIGAGVPLLGDLSEQRAKAAYLTTLGRLAQQMAHDVRNPLAAIKGAAQFLQEEQARGRSIDQQGAMLGVIVERVDRLERCIADYQRMGRVEPVLRLSDVRALLTVAGELVSSIGGSKISVDLSLENDLPQLSIDSDLMSFALENLVRNACEAMPTGGVVSLRAELSDGGRRVRITVADAGEGMEARTRERVLEGFYSTKEGGSGLGLSFVRRVVEAHGGQFRLASALGKGTRVSFELTVPPVAPL